LTAVTKVAPVYPGDFSLSSTLGNFVWGNREAWTYASPIIRRNRRKTGQVTDVTGDSR